MHQAIPPDFQVECSHNMAECKIFTSTSKINDLVIIVGSADCRILLCTTYMTQFSSEAVSCVPKCLGPSQTCERFCRNAVFSHYSRFGQRLSQTQVSLLIPENSGLSLSICATSLFFKKNKASKGQLILGRFSAAFDGECMQASLEARCPKLNHSKQLFCTEVLIPVVWRSIFQTNVFMNGFLVARSNKRNHAHSFQ